MSKSLKIKIAIGLVLAFLAGDYQATIRAKGKRKNIINYYEKALKKESLSDDVICWANMNLHGMTPEEFQTELRNKLAYLRVSING